MSVGRSFIFLGPELGERRDAIERLKSELTASCGGALEEYILYASETGVSELVSHLLNASLFSPKRFFQYRNVELVKNKEELELLSAYLKKPAEDTVLVLSSDETSCDKRLEAALPKEAKRVFWELFDNRKTDLVASIFRRAGFRIDEEGINTVLDLVENNTDALRRECGRLILFLDKDKPVNADVVEDCLAHNREESAFTLFSRIAAGDLEKSLSTARALAASKQVPVQILAGLAWCFRRLADYVGLKDSGRLNDSGLRSIGLSSPRARKDYAAASERYDAASVHRCLALIAEYDMAFKSGTAALEEAQMDLFLYRLSRMKGRRVF